MQWPRCSLWLWSPEPEVKLCWEEAQWLCPGIFAELVLLWAGNGMLRAAGAWVPDVCPCLLPAGFPCSVWRTPIRCSCGTVKDPCFLGWPLLPIWPIFFLLFSTFSSLFYFLEFYSRRRRKNSALVIVLPTVPHRGGWSLPFYEFLPERMAALAQRLGIM